ncbi:MAG TPA: heparinase II/III-family protein, partial [Chromatiaceae bacterium]|nr:heparinase II/III-family protein [Chromatiaceae bacterium]
HWHRNPFTGAEVPDPERPWWRIPDFDASLGDIKTIWEASRFDWVLTFAQHACLGEPEGLERLNAWLADWVAHNPPYRGPNWKCGQEASIRVLHLAVAALLLGQIRRPTPALVGLLVAHLRRIAPTLQYAIAQDNNHGTSEAAALFIGGTWLAALGEPTGVAPGVMQVQAATESRRWARLGRHWLENRAARLIEVDGSFSQYSVNYHRLMLDTYSLVEHWRRCLELPAFSPRLHGRLAAATRSLQAMTQPETGDAPVLGANDGAWLLPFGESDYRDYRPAVQLATALFLDRRAYGGAADAGASWNLPLRWLGIPVPTRPAEPPGAVQFDAGGYSLLRRGPAFALLRYPRFRFRPSQADALHVDLWVKGQNLLRDAGSFSYNMGDDWLRYFSGTAGHNTIQFDDRDQMPRLSRFLFGDWLRAEAVLSLTQVGDEAEAEVQAEDVAEAEAKTEADAGTGAGTETSRTLTTAAAYTDAQGARHRRQVWLATDRLRVEDEVFGFASKAVLRWRLAPGDWRQAGDTVRRDDTGNALRVTASVPIARMELVQGWESRYYLQRVAVPVLEVEITQPGRLVSDYVFGPTDAEHP